MTSWIDTLGELAPPLLDGLGVTLQVMAGAAALAAPLAVVAGVGRLSTRRPLRWLASVYVEVFRGTSALVQLFWFYFVLPLFGCNCPPCWSASWCWVERRRLWRRGGARRDRAVPPEPARGGRGAELHARADPAAAGSCRRPCRPCCRRQAIC